MATPKPRDGVSAPDDAVAKLAEAEKALLSIRQARDTIVAHSRDLAAKLERAEDQVSDLSEQCEIARRAAEAMERTERAGRTEREELRRKCEELRRKLRDFNEQRIFAQETEGQAAVALNVVRREVAEATEERDRLRGVCSSLREENDQLRRELEEERSTAAEAAQDASDRFRELQTQIDGMQKDLDQVVTLQKKKIGQLTTQSDSDHRTREAAIINVIKLQKRVMAMKGEMEAMRKQSKEERVIFRARIAALEAQADERANAIELECESPSSGEPETAEVSDDHVLELENVGASELEPMPVAAPFPATEAAAVLQSLAGELGRLSLDEHDNSLLEKLDQGFRTFDERVRASGDFSALLRASAACAEVLSWLRRSPSKIGLALPCLTEMIPVLSDLLALPTAAWDAVDPYGATVFTVDDDVDNCECISMALEKLDFRTFYSVTSEIALAQIEAATADLIVLDVDMPKVDGFQLYRRIRESARHRRTPVIFVSGLMQTREQIKQLPDGYRDFLPKPYNLTILGAKAMTVILRSRLDSTQSVADVA